MSQKKTWMPFLVDPLLLQRLPQWCPGLGAAQSFLPGHTWPPASSLHVHSKGGGQVPAKVQRTEERRGLLGQRPGSVRPGQECGDGVTDLHLPHRKQAV